LKLGKSRRTYGELGPGVVVEKVSKNSAAEKAGLQEALRWAQMKIRKQDRWSQPYYWAGFVIQGEWR
jgi:S1-C subfamily serine protease